MKRNNASIYITLGVFVHKDSTHRNYLRFVHDISIYGNHGKDWKRDLEKLDFLYFSPASRARHAEGFTYHFFVIVVVVVLVSGLFLTETDSSIILSGLVPKTFLHHIMSFYAFSLLGIFPR